MSTFDRNWRELQLQTLVDLSLRIGGVRSEAELVDELLQRAVGTLDAGFGLVGTFGPEDREATVRSVGFPASLEKVRTLFDADLLEELAVGKVVRLVRDAPEPPFELLAAPLLWRTRMTGMVVIADKETREGLIPFTDSEARFLQSMASLVAAAIATSRKVAEIERDRQRLEQENRALRDVAQEAGFVGDSPPVREMLDLVRRVAGTGVNIMLRGESGVGKERVAKLVHQYSDRSQAPFVALSCAALPETLLEAELFGIEEGVATGVQARLGKIELAHGGTLFLDEVGDTSLALQAKLLRLIQEREFERIGGREPIRMDVQLVTATNRDLEAMVENGEFRQDLYYRLRVVVIDLPALRDRRTDIPLLVRHFLEIYGERFGRPGLSLSREALAVLMAHSFPGNVRELENAIQAAVALAPSEVIVEDDLRLPGSETGGPSRGSLVTLAEVERRHIERVLAAVNGNRVAASQILGLDRSTLYRKMLRFATNDANSNN